MGKGNNAIDTLAKFAMMDKSIIFKSLSSSPEGLDKAHIIRQKNTSSSNLKFQNSKDTVLHRLRRAFINPFSVVLLILAIISLFTDVILISPKERNFTTFAIILFMLLLSGTVRFIQEMHSKKVSDSLTDMVTTYVRVKRDGGWEEINSSGLIPGDIISLKAGERVPADVRILKAQDLFVSQSVITGESESQEKYSETLKDKPLKIADFTNILFCGTNISSGLCDGIVITTGANTLYGGCRFDSFAQKDGFDKGANSIAMVLIKFMTVLVPIVFISCGLTKGNWFSALLFSLSAAVGLTPELLPMVITACLAKGSFNMGKKQTIVKNINAMQGFGSMDILCVDKTGTLTGDKLILEYYMDILGNESSEVLDCAFLNSFYHTGIKNHLDLAISDAQNMPGKEEHWQELIKAYTKLDELPFDHNRKTSSVLLKDNEKNYMISKGNIYNILEKCTHANYKGQKIALTKDAINSVNMIVKDMLEDGMKVIAVSARETNSDTISLKDEKDMTLLGYIAFFDAPKKSAKSAIKKLSNLNVKVKVLTGDNLDVAISVCKRLDMDHQYVMTGAEFEKLSDNDAQVSVEKTSIFAELTPDQKSKIVSLLESNGHTVGFLGDGMNDLQAVINADVGISIDTAAKSVKEAADVILLKKDLNVLEEGILEGRKAFINMSKYIKITASSNFGNIIAIVAASIFLPFFPMTSVQILLLNLLYDILCLVLPWDKVDDELLLRPLDWSGSTLGRFMAWFGPISSIFDITTFIFLIIFLCPYMCGGPFGTLTQSGQAQFIAVFQTGWFLESMWTQVLIIHLLRTKKLLLLQSKTSKPVLIVTILGITVFTILAMRPIGSVLGLTMLPAIYFVFLICTVICYLLVVTIAKRNYISRYNELI